MGTAVPWSSAKVGATVLTAAAQAYGRATTLPEPGTQAGANEMVSVIISAPSFPGSERDRSVRLRFGRSRVIGERRKDSRAAPL
jgi:hypothetical protein